MDLARWQQSAPLLNCQPSRTASTSNWSGPRQCVVWPNSRTAHRAYTVAAFQCPSLVATCFLPLCLHTAPVTGSELVWKLKSRWYQWHTSIHRHSITSEGAARPIWRFKMMHIYIFESVLLEMRHKRLFLKTPSKTLFNLESRCQYAPWWAVARTHTHRHHYIYTDVTERWESYIEVRRDHGFNILSNVRWWHMDSWILFFPGLRVLDASQKMNHSVVNNGFRLEVKLRIRSVWQQNNLNHAATY